ncbi:MAG: flagellar basal body L-ring protein FlgH [Opitutaceae bacterium]
MSKSIFSLLLAVALTASAHANSLWPATGKGSTGMYGDHKAANTGDILTIVVAESAVAQNSQTKKSERDSSINDAVSNFIYPSIGARGGVMPSLGITGKASYTGGGEISNSQSLTARAAVLVTDVLPNGNLVIEGARIVTFSGETQYVVLHGIVRPDDIVSDNTLLSTNIADARVEFYSEGALTDAQKRGWFAKLYEKLRPI